MDFGIYKDTKITERFSLQLRGEAFNVFNHANLCAVGEPGPIRGQGISSARATVAPAQPYDRRNLQLAAKLIF
jgi:hypothetical protein